VKLVPAAAAVVLALVLAAPALADPAKVGYPNSIASTGDSITRAFNTGGFPFTDAPANSWSTGTNTSVNSHYSRILAANPAVSGHNPNDAKSGAKMTDLNGQATTVNTQAVDYVTILMGANDVCTSSEAAMTPVDTLRTQFQSALTTLTAGSPNTRIFVASIPNIYNLWSVLKDNGSARFVWGLYGICQSMLANPTSTAQADVDRRNRVRQRNIDDNAALAQVCAQYVHCRFDGSAAFNLQFAASDVSTRDYFHPSISGQAKAAAVTWSATYNFTDAVAPVSTAGTSGGLVTLSATDNVGVAGIEYKLDAGGWTRYSAPVALAPGSTLTYRAVDVNGNIEATKTIAG
jgi:lysophospholipase L1-like esterase